MAVKDFVVEYVEKDWLDIEKLGLTPEDEQAIVDENMFRAAFLDLKIRVGKSQAGKTELAQQVFEKICKNHVEKAAASWQTRVREMAGKVFRDVVTAWRAEQSPDEATGQEGKQAIAGVKKLEDFLKKVLSEMPRDMRERAAKAMDMSADDFFTVNESDYDVRIRTDLLAGLEDSEAEALVKKQDDKLKKMLANKGEWMSCAVVWLTREESRLIVSKKDIVGSILKDESELLDDSKVTRKFWGKVYATGSKLYFQFLGKLPGGAATETALEKMVERQVGRKIDCKVNSEDMAQFDVTKKYDVEADDSAIKSKQDSKAKKKQGKDKNNSGQLAAPSSKRGGK